MTINYTTLLALGQPVTGTESGVWGNVVNNSVTTYLDSAISGTLSLTTDANVTLTSTQGTAAASNLGTTSAQYKILSCSGSRSTIRTITVPTNSRAYVVLNNTTGGFAVTVKGSATTGVNISNGEYAVVAWNQSTSDFVKLGSSAGAAAGGSNTQVQFNNSGVLGGSASMTWNGTVLTSTFGGPHNGTVGATTPASGAFTTLSASSAVTLSPASSTVTISPTGTGTVAISPAGTLTLNPTAASTINNMSIGASTASTGAFTTLSASSTVSGTGFSTYLASPPAIGGTTPAAGSFTTLSASGNFTANGTNAAVNISPTGTGTVAISPGGAVTMNPSGASTINNTSIGATTASTGRFTTVTSTIATGTAPFTVASTTNVANLNASSLNGATFAAPGPLGSTTASTGAHTTLTCSGQITSTVAGGTAPFVITSTTNVANLNASSLNGATFAAPGAIGGTTAGSGAFTTLSASSTVSGTGFSNYLASPPAIGGTAPAAITGTTVSDSAGNLRTIVQNSQGTYTLAATDNGKHILATGTITVPASIFTAGQVVTIFNNTASNMTITTSAVTCYLAGTATTGARTLAQRGIATVLCVAANTFVISGGGLT